MSNTAIVGAIWLISKDWGREINYFFQRPVQFLETGNQRFRKPILFVHKLILDVRSAVTSINM